MAELVLFQAVEPSYLTDPAPQMALAEDYLAGHAKKMSGSVHSVARIGSPAGRLLDLADEIGADLLVVSPHGTAGERSIGRVTEKLMHSASVPLFIVPPEANSLLNRAGIVVPLDGSKISETGVAAAGDLAKTLQTSVTLVHVLGDRGESSAFPFRGFEELAGRHREDMASYLQAQAASLSGRGIPTKTQLLEGRFPDDLLRFCSREGIPLIVMSAHGRGVLNRHLLGSAARELVEITPFPVLLIRQR